MTSTWTAPAVDRPEPDRIADERTSLDQWLDFQRTTLLMKCAGLSPEQLVVKSVPPSSMSLIGLVRHMTDVERWWFRRHADGQDVPQLFWLPGNDDSDFDDVTPAQVEGDYERFLAEVEACRAAVAGKALDDVVASRGDHPERTRDIRWIYVHMIEEYARHNGHADLLRELVDGTTGM
jgi:uncharacterized damage-inducible protein DinB